MSSIYLSGGIGNQLFQISFGHYLNLIQEEKVYVVKPRLKTGLPHTHLTFFQEDYRCEHCTYRIHQGNPLWNELMNPWSDRPSVRLLRRFKDFRGQPFISREKMGKTSAKNTYLGYFQNIEFIKPIAETIHREITQVLEAKEKKLPLFTEQRNIEVIHIRQGDTNSPVNKKRVGILNRDFYERILRRRTGFGCRIVVTDDVEGAKRVLQGIEVDCIYGPDDLDPWQSLSVMTNATRLVVANSTFSWWGGFLALRNEAEVIIPKPFFISSELDTRGALKYPGFMEAESSFIQ